MTTLPVSVCIVDDDAEFSSFLRQYLEARGFKSRSFGSAEDLLQSDTIAQADFFIFDLMLPGIDGIELISLVRNHTEAGILVISGRMGPDSFNSALAAGADMFINKPVRFDQVYHAVTSIARRAVTKPVAQKLWKLDRMQEFLTAPNGQKIALSRIETQLFTALQEASGEPLTRAELATASDSSGPELRNLDAAIFRLRRKIERETRLPSPIRTVHGVGYQLSEPVQLAPEQDA